MLMKDSGLDSWAKEDGKRCYAYGGRSGRVEEATVKLDFGNKDRGETVADCSEI